MNCILSWPAWDVPLGAACTPSVPDGAVPGKLPTGDVSDCPAGMVRGSIPVYDELPPKSGIVWDCTAVEIVTGPTDGWLPPYPTTVEDCPGGRVVGGGSGGCTGGSVCGGSAIGGFAGGGKVVDGRVGGRPAGCPLAVYCVGGGAAIAPTPRGAPTGNVGAGAAE